jgi:hypothetical protein
MQHLTTAFRYGEAHVRLDGDLVHITTDIEFNNLIVSYVTPDMIRNQFREHSLTMLQAYRRLLKLGEPSLNYCHSLIEFLTNTLYLYTSGSRFWIQKWDIDTLVLFLILVGSISLCF